MLVTVQDIANKSFDYVIVGGGTAGLTLASRLSEDPTNTVCVLEAGDVNHDDPNIVKIENFGKTMGYPHYDWSMFTTKQEILDGRALLLSRGKGLGGSSAMNVMFWGKPPAAEIDDLERLGNPGWNWEVLQSYFTRVERYVPPLPEASEKFQLGVESRDIGSQGAVPVSFPSEVSESELYFTDALRNAGFSPAPHPYGGDPTGFYTPLYNHDVVTGTRAYSYNSYYLPCKDRKNLVVLTNALVGQIVTEKTSQGLLGASGVEFIHGEKTYIAKAKKEVIISAGLQSAQVLELSGIGRRDVLGNVGVEVKLELPGVGQNVQEHIIGGFNFELKKGHELFKHDMVAVNEATPKDVRSAGRFSLGLSKFAFLPVEQVTPRAQAIYDRAKANLSKLEKDGVSPGLIDQYKIQLERLRPGQHQSGPGCELMLVPSFIPGVSGITVQPEEGKAYMGTCWALNHTFSRGTIHITSKDPAQPPGINPRYFDHDIDMEIALETAKVARRIPLEIAPLSDIVEKEIGPSSSISTAEELREFIKKEFSTTWHTCGSCSMLPKDKGGVVDHQLKVYGTANIRVVDLSILPLHFAAHPQSFVYAIAERAADIIRGKL